MKSEILNEYDAEEQGLLHKLDELFRVWQSRWDGKVGWFVRDGFYPGYLKANKKILFIGRDCYDMYNLNGEAYGCYISTLLPMYKAGRMNSEDGWLLNVNKTLDSDVFTPLGVNTSLSGIRNRRLKNQQSQSRSDWHPFVGFASPSGGIGIASCPSRHGN